MTCAGGDLDPRYKLNIMSYQKSVRLLEKRAFSRLLHVRQGAAE